MSGLLIGNSATDKIYSDDVFSTYLYTGNGATQTITNGIDLAGKGGMVWQKCRSTLQEHYVVDTARGNTKWLETQSTSAEQTAPGTTNVKSFDSTGFTLGGDYAVGPNVSGRTYASWTFRKAPKFFDVVTYTGDGVAGRTVAHSLGSEPGCIIIKQTSSPAADWIVYHRSLGNTKYIRLNLTDSEITNSSYWNNTTPTSTNFSLGTNSNVNGNSSTYVAYIFAHDTTTDGIIQCGSYAGTSAAGNVISLGFEPQWVMIKEATGAATGGWFMIDNMRGMPVGSVDAYLSANASDAEASPLDMISPTATGVSIDYAGGSINTSGRTYIYLAIRRPNKPPTSGTQVFAPVTTATNSVTLNAGFAADAIFLGRRDNGQAFLGDRLRGANVYLTTSSTGAENTLTPSWGWDNMQGVYLAYASWVSGAPGVVGEIFRRAPGVFDVACVTGTGAGATYSHNLGVTPELMIQHGRSLATDWECFTPLGKDFAGPFLNKTNAASAFSNYWTAPTATTFKLQSSIDVNTSTYVVYLFATLAGISKVGSYTGTGTSQTINCGFTAGARFVLIKRTDSTGDWYVWDSTRGIVASADPHLSLNSAVAEVTTDDSVDPDASGFIVNQDAATNINVNAGTYIFLAFA